MWNRRGSGNWQQTAAPARALQAGGRPSEPGTAHTPGWLSDAKPPLARLTTAACRAKEQSSIDGSFAWKATLSWGRCSRRW
jgi:hypothetical protein